MYISEIHFGRYADWVYPSWHVAIREMKRPILTDISLIKPGDVIYSVTNALDVLSEALANITVPFILITGLSDNFIPWQSDCDQFPKRNEAYKLLENKFLLAWFGLNKMENHPLLHHIPIGIPRCKVFFGEEQKTAPSPYMAFYADLYGHEAMHAYLEKFRPETILQRMKEKPIEKDNLIYCRYTTHNSEITLLKRNYRFRHKLDEHLKKVGLPKLGLCNWEEHIKDLEKYRFVVCPPGRCLDGFLLWESIILGVIPVVFTSELDDLYDNLPVLILKNIEELTPELLEEKHKEFIERFDYNFRKLTMEYWIEKIEFFKKQVKTKEVNVLGIITDNGIFCNNEKVIKELKSFHIDKNYIITKIDDTLKLYIKESLL